MDSTRIKAVIDLHEYVDSLGTDRPRVSEILKSLAINPQAAWDSVTSTAHAVNCVYPEIAIDMINRIFKIGITIGYKYAIKKEMERQFPTSDSDNNDDNKKKSENKE